MKDKDSEDQRNSQEEQKASSQLTPSEEREIAEIFQSANGAVGQQLTVNEIGELKSEKEIRDFAFGPIDNPEKKHEVFYHGIQKLLKRYLPNGKENKRLRDFINEEKNILLNRGKKKDARGIRGSDSRMGYLGDHDMVLEIISEWIISKGTPFELWSAMRKKNVELGYIGGKADVDGAKKNDREEP